MGTPDFAVPTLDALVAAGHEVVAVYTPAAAAGRARQGRAADRRSHERAERARASRCAPRDPEGRGRTGRIRGARGRCRGGRRLWPDPAAADPRCAQLGCLNVHASLLPRWRGAAPVQRAILAGDDGDRRHHHADGGRARHRADAGKRAGCDRRQELPAQLTDELAEIGAATDGRGARRAARRYARVRSPTTASPTPPRSTRPRRGSTGPATGRAGRAPGAGLATRPRRLVRARGRADQGARRRTVPRRRCRRATVLDDRLTIACGEGALRPTLVQRAGRGAMSAEELLRGFPIADGNRAVMTRWR